MAEAKYCEKCRRIKGVGCACGVPFGEKAKGQQMVLGSFKAVRG